MFINWVVIVIFCICVLAAYGCFFFIFCETLLLWGMRCCYLSLLETFRRVLCPCWTVNPFWSWSWHCSVAVVYSLNPRSSPVEMPKSHEGATVVASTCSSMPYATFIEAAESGRMNYQSFCCLVHLTVDWLQTGAISLVVLMRKKSHFMHHRHQEGHPFCKKSCADSLRRHSWRQTCWGPPRARSGSYGFC